MLKKLNYVLLAYLFQPFVPLSLVILLFIFSVVALLAPTETEKMAYEAKLKQINISNCEITKAINSNKRLYEVKCES